MIFFLLICAAGILAPRRRSAGRVANRAASWAAMVALAAAHGGALADTFDGGAIANCTYVAASKTYTCSALNNSSVASFTIPSGYTVIVSAPVDFSYNQHLSMSGSASLQSSSGGIDLTDINPAFLDIAGGTLVAKGALALGIKAITADLTADSLTTVSNSKVTGSLTVANAIALNSSTTIVGAVSAGSLTAGSSLNIDGPVSVTGAVKLQSATTIKGTLSGATIITGSGSSFTGDVTASGSFALASGGKLVGNITAPVVEIQASPSTVTGNIEASTSLKLESGATVNGNVTGGSLQMDPSPVVINGNATMTGDVDIGSGDTINGDLKARNVMTRSSNAYISGNAYVNAITLNYAAKVGKTIYCTAPGSVNCSCVTNNSGYGMPAPTCAAGQPPPANGPDHIQISHTGTALTCQPQTVTLTACANASCSAPHYSGSVAVTLQPGGKQFTVTNGVNNAATVEQVTAGTAALSSSSHAYTCVNSGDPTHPCDMVFKTSGLVVSAPSHVSMASATLTIEAKTASGNYQSCVPLVTNKTVGIDMACTYNDPTSGTVQPKVGSTSLTCGGGTTSVPFTFNADGIATAALEYADVGKMDVKASYAATGAGTAFTADGAATFIAAPKAFVIVATNAVTGVSTATTPDIFAKASEAFTVKVSAVNAAGNVTKNFGRESTPENVVFLDPTVVPSDAGTSGIISKGQFGAFSNGASSSISGSLGQWNFSDVGAIKLDAKLANASSYYMGNTALLSFITTGTLNIGRFIPDHFDTVLMTNGEIAAFAPNQPGGRSMSCVGMVTSVNPCAGTSSNFVYSRQPFFLKVLAYNGASPTPALTSNYAKSLAKPVTISAWTGVGGLTASTAGVLAWSGADPKFSFAAGVGMLAAPEPKSAPATIANLPNFAFPKAYPQADITPVTIYLRAIDTDGVSSKRLTNSVEAPLTVVSGRLLVANAYGSQNSPLPVDASAQYYMPSGYVFNPLVNTVSAGTVAGSIGFSNCQGALDTGSHHCPSLGVANTNDVLTLASGKGKFRLAPPSPTLTGKGSVDVSLGLLFDYLPSTTGRETFGIYRSGPVIYTREVHN